MPLGWFSRFVRLGDGASTYLLGYDGLTHPAQAPYPGRTLTMAYGIVTSASARRSGLALSVAAVAFAGACGSGTSNTANSNNSNQAPTTQTTSNAANQQVLNEVYKGTLSSPDTTARPAVKNKKIVIISAGQSSISSSIPVNAAKEAAQAIGWNVTV